MSHTVLTLQEAWQQDMRLDLVGLDHKASIAWTRVHAIMKSGTCAKAILSGRDRSAYLTPRGDTRSAGSSSTVDAA